VAFEELKERQSVAWGAAPFELVESSIAVMHDDLVGRLHPRSGEQWLDVGCGAGAVAMRAARAGADVTGLDLSPVLIETATRRAEGDGLRIQYEVGDAEALPFGDASFDVVSSSVGAVFAPDQLAVARELARVTRPGGRVGLTAWKEDGGMGDFFRLVSAFQPPLPEGAGDPHDWAREEHATGLLGGAFELEFADGDAPQTGESGEEVWEFMVAGVGPLKLLIESLDGDRGVELHRSVVDFYEGQRQADGSIRHSRSYLVVLGMRR
jgi:SAM-dependent methyltransferase